MRCNHHVAKRHRIHRAKRMTAQYGVGEWAAREYGKRMPAHELEMSTEQNDRQCKHKTERGQWRRPDETENGPDPEEWTLDVDVVHE